MFNSQAGQDQFILSMLNKKRNGYFLEIGTHDPIYINNTYVLEKEYGWTGLMVEYDKSWESSYIQERKSKYIIQDARKVDYKDLLKKYNFPKAMDYLQIDLEVNNRSTLDTLELLDSTIFPEYTFSVITFEHDIYKGDYYSTRMASREIFSRNGYVRVFGDVKSNGYPFEDWYVHPLHVDMDYINRIKSDVATEWKDIIKLLD